MSDSHAYDTVAFDVRDNTTMLFFARTTDEGEIRDYLLFMRSVEPDFDETFSIEANEQLIDGNEVLEEARLLGNTLTLSFNRPVEILGNASEFVLTFDETESNVDSMESGAFRVLGEFLKGGTA
ncbi:MAG: hypothetical protein AAFX10_17330 [Pseudomonadota bacterium]